MKYKHTTLLCLFAVLLISLPLSGYAATQDEQGRFLYLNIPYDTITPEGVDQILLDTFGDIQYNEYGDYHITDFGYDFSFAVNFNEDLRRANRIILSIPYNDSASDDAFQALFTSDVMQFVDMDAQLVGRYGEPNFRFFFTHAKNYKMKGNTRFMFPGDVWNARQMLDVLDTDRYLEAYSCWDNITLRGWINWLPDAVHGHYSRLTLAFYDTLYPKEPPFPIIGFPPDSGN